MSPHGAISAYRTFLGAENALGIDFALEPGSEPGSAGAVAACVSPLEWRDSAAIRARSVLDIGIRKTSRSYADATPRSDQGTTAWALAGRKGPALITIARRSI